VLPDLQRAIEILRGPEGDRRRARVWSAVETFAQALGLSETPASPIVPLLVGPNDAALQLSRQLLERGWHVQAIRPPTVPEGTARLRVTLSAAHTDEEILGLAADLRALFDAQSRPLRTGAAA
jgi:7-keto-8-aminopelargonate synthetase-like enzyme